MQNELFSLQKVSVTEQFVDFFSLTEQNFCWKSGTLLQNHADQLHMFVH